MLGADLLGFHIPYHVDNFLNTVDQTLEVRVDKVSSTIISSGRETLVKPFQISVDYEKMSSDANLPELQSEIEEKIKLML